MLTAIIGFLADVIDQDHSAHEVQPDFGFKLSSMYRKTKKELILELFQTTKN